MNRNFNPSFYTMSPTHSQILIQPYRPQERIRLAKTQTKQNATVFDQLVSHVTITDPTHALFGRTLPVPLKKTQIALRLDSDVLTWFKAQGPGYQTRINAILKAYKEAHEKSQATT